MLTISRYLNTSKKPSEDHGKALSQLVEALAVHAVNCPGTERATFQKELRSLNESLELASEPGASLLVTDQIAHALQEYHRETEEFFAAHGREVQSIIDLLTNSLLAASKNNGRAGESLRKIEKRLERATRIEDIRTLRIEMRGVLQRIQIEARQQELQAENSRKDLNLSDEGQSSLPGRAQPPAVAAVTGDTDEVTGLSSVRLGEAAIQTLTKDGPCVQPVVFFVERLDLINNRYGVNAGDQILMNFSQLLAQSLRSGDQLFRWRGSGFVGLFQSREGIDVRSEVRRFAAQKIEQMVEVDGRKVLMTVSTAFAFMPASTESSPGDILSRIDSFVEEQASRAVR